MNAKTVIEIVVYGGLIPAIAAIAGFFAVDWLWPEEAARRYKSGAAFALAVFVGFVALPTTSSLVPTQFWERIPYLGLLAAFVSGLTRAGGVLRGERWATIYLLALVSAWLMVPSWPELTPVWPIQLALLAIGTILLTALLVPLPSRLPGHAFPFWLMFAAATVSALVMLEVSETFGRLTALPAGALVGCGLATVFRRNEVDWRSLALPYSVVVVGCSYVGAVYPTAPLWPFVVIPAAPLALWLCAYGPLARLRGVRAVAAQAACIALPLIVLVLLLTQASGSAGEW